MNKMKNIAPFVLIVIILSYSCAPRPASRTGKKADFEENLAAHRPKYEPTITPFQQLPSSDISRNKEYPEPRQDLTSQINTLLDTIAERNHKINYVQGYTIVIRGGQLEEASTIRQRVMNLFPETSPELAFDRPIYKVKVGQFYSKIEANKLYSMIKKEFPNRVILAPEVIYLY
jgi:ribosomal protein L19